VRLTGPASNASLWPAGHPVADTEMDDSRAIESTPTVATRAVQASRLNAVWDFVARQLVAHRTIIKFAAVGTLGYIIYTSLLLLLYDLSALPFLPSKDTSVDLLLFTHGDSLLLITTLIGTQASIIGVFIGHYVWTFTDWQTVRKPLWLRFLQFEARALASTLGILTVAVNGMAVGLGVHPFVGVPVGFVAAFTWNWLWDTKFIWRKSGV